jgi:asparagine synthase (glutamine-hydrolysing)
MRRRGPDHAASFSHCFSPDRHVYLLHSRLSIIDLQERANQPFRSGSKVLVYNGELYNYLELRKELVVFGCRFDTESDTEVLLQTLIRFGWQGLDKCEGMWAFALYDEENGSLLLSRDRFAEKPLYLYKDVTGLYFGSEVKFIFALLGHPLNINYDHLYRYLVNGYKALYKVKETFFEGLRELPSATVLSLDRYGSEKEYAYWKPTFQPDESMTYEQVVEGVRERVIHSVRLRLRADVPLAFCMSGGIDSNSLISIAKRILDYDVHGFTVMNRDTRYEEKEFVEYSVKELGIRHTAMPIRGGQFLENLVQLVRQHDAPIYTTSYYVHWLLMGHIADHGYRISISGTGADELLTGYYDHHNLYLYEIRHTPLFEKMLNAWSEHIAPLVRNRFLKNPQLFFENPDFRYHIYLDNTEFAGYLTKAWGEEFREVRYTDSLLRNRMLNEMFHEAVPVILHEDDLNAMYYSIENRSPYLDRELFEFCYRIPTRYLVRDGFAKVILRDAMSGIVPNKILWNHRKVGFNAPVLDFLNVKDIKTREWLLDEGPVFQHINRNKIEELLRKNQLPNSESKFLFYFLCAKVFLEEFAGS